MASPRVQLLALATVLVAVTLAAFGEVRSFPFVLYDDTQYVTGNPFIQQGLTLASMRWALTAFEASNWHPLTWWSHMLDWQLYGQNAGGHHVTSLVLHTINVVLLFLALTAMTKSPGRSAVVAALFAVHPLRVESVAQIAERKDVLSGTFWMLTLLAYVGYARRPSVPRYAWVCLGLALGLMAKSMLVTLPCVLLLLDWWPLGRIVGAPRSRADAPFPLVTPQRAIVEKLPLLGLAGIASGLTFVSFSQAGLVATFAARPLGDRVANALLSYVSYMTKTFWPFGFSCLYPYPKSFDPMSVVAAGGALVATTGLALYLARSRPYLATGWLWYLGVLVPANGLVQQGNQAMADHYTYLPLIGVFLVITWGAWDLAARIPQRAIVLAVIAALAIGFCIARTRVEAAYWRDTHALFERALEVTPNNAVAHNNLGLALRAEGRSAEAMAHFSAALAEMPGYVEARNHLGLTQRDLGDPTSAVASFQDAINRDPDFAPAHFNLGETLLVMGDGTRALEELETTVRLVPTHAEAHLQLSRIFVQQGNPAKGLEHARTALTLLPTSPAALACLADALSVAGNLDEAIAYYGEALRLKPDDVDATFNLGNTLARRGRMNEAIDAYRRTVALAPDYTQARDNLARALAAQETNRQ